MARMARNHRRKLAFVHQRMPGRRWGGGCDHGATIAATAGAALTSVNKALAPGKLLSQRPDLLAAVADYLGQLAATLALAWSPGRIGRICPRWRPAPLND